MSGAVRYEGVVIIVGGEDLTLPPLNWAGAKKFFKHIVAGEINNPEIAIDLMPEMLLAALIRNYPDLTMAALEQVITPGELLAAIPILMTMSGFTQAQAGEA